MSMRASEDSIPLIGALKILIWFFCSHLTSLLNSHSSYGNAESTLLHFAILKHNIKLAELLLSYGASPATPDSQGQTPLQLAQKLGFLKFVELLQNHINLVNDDKDSAETLVGDYGAYFQASTFSKCLII